MKWDLVTKPQADGGLGFGGLRAKNLAVLAKCGWRYMEEDKPLRCQVVRSIHGKDPHNWHMAGKIGNSLRSPWISISRTWLKVEALAMFKIENSSIISFWSNPWDGLVPLCSSYPRLFKVA